MGKVLDAATSIHDLALFIKNDRSRETGNVISDIQRRRVTKCTKNMEPIHLLALYNFSHFAKIFPGINTNTEDSQAFVLVCGMQLPVFRDQLNARNAPRTPKVDQHILTSQCVQIERDVFDGDRKSTRLNSSHV